MWNVYLCSDGPIVHRPVELQTKSKFWVLRLLLGPGVVMVLEIGSPSSFARELELLTFVEVK